MRSHGTTRYHTLLSVRLPCPYSYAPLLHRGCRLHSKQWAGKCRVLMGLLCLLPSVLKNVA